MDDIMKRFATIRWSFADQDPRAPAQLEARISAVGRARSLITYSELVRGVPFYLSNLKECSRIIDVAAWQDLDRSIVGDFLGYIIMRSYERAGIFASALVVSKMDGTPGEGFYNLFELIGLVGTPRGETAYDLWVKHVSKAHDWFAGDQRAALG